MKSNYQTPKAELGEFSPGLSLLEDSGSLSGNIDDFELIDGSWDY